MGNRHLHFVVRDSNYIQNPGYGYFMDHVLDQLNEQPITNPEKLLQKTAACMANETDGPWDPENGYYGYTEKDRSVLLQCLPDDIRSKLERREISFETCFGPIMAIGFGKICFPTPESVGRHASILSTPFLLNNDGHRTQYRGYWDIVKNNHQLDENALEPNWKIEFSYPIPGTDERLPLMQIGSPNALAKDYIARYSNPSDFGNEAEEIRKLPFDGNAELLFLHSPYNQQYHEKLLKCLQPLWDTLVKPLHNVSDTGQPLPNDKMNAMIDIYWLLAQSTPPERGGSAFARAILEHMSHILREQGYHYVIPYTAESVDLWAEAASLPLNDNEMGIKNGFRTRFKKELFFDLSMDDRTVTESFSKIVSTKQIRGLPSL